LRFEKKIINNQCSTLNIQVEELINLSIELPQLRKEIINNQCSTLNIQVKELLNLSIE